MRHFKGSAVVLLLFCNLFSSTILEAASGGTNGSSFKWGFGTSLTYPVESIYMVQGSYSLWDMGDVLAGAAFQHWNDKGQSNAYTLLLGYRQFIWKGFHTEFELWPAYNRFVSSVDGKTYKGLELWMSFRIGYRLDIELSGREFFILAQPSIGFGAGSTNPWPENKGHAAVFEPQVIVGMRF